MKSFALLTTIMVLCFTAPDCRKPGGTPGLPPEQAAQARRAIVTYLECEECEVDQVDAVIKLGQVAVPTLVATLLEGPPRTNLEVYRRHLTARYRELKQYEQTHPQVTVPGSEQQYVESYLNNYVALYRVRAATALAAIGGADAKRALEEASRMTLRNDEREAVKASLEKIRRQ